MTFGVIQRPWENLNVKSDGNYRKENCRISAKSSNFMVVTTSRDDHRHHPTHSRPSFHEVVSPLYRMPETSPHHQRFLLPSSIQFRQGTVCFPPVLIIHHIKATDSKLFRWFPHISHVCIVSCGCCTSCTEKESQKLVLKK